MSKDAIEPIAQGLPRDSRLDGDRLLNFRQPRIARFNGDAAPVDAIFFETRASFSDGRANRLRIMIGAGGEKSLIGQNELSFGNGLEMRFRKILLKQARQAFGLALKIFGE